MNPVMIIRKCDRTVATAVSLQTQEDSGRDGQIINKE